jgi:hypothetical protein
MSSPGRSERQLNMLAPHDWRGGTVVGPSGTRYRVAPDRLVIFVDPRDGPGLAKMGFRAVERPN